MITPSIGMPMQATFTNATTLALNGLTSSAQSYGAGAKTGIYPIQNFTDGSANSQYVDSNGAPACHMQSCSAPYCSFGCSCLR